MRPEFFIASRYLRSRHGSNAIHIISAVSSVAVAVVTAAMICVMSVMNGFEREVSAMFSRFDAELRIEPASGKTLDLTTPAMQAVMTMPDIAIFAPTIEEMALVEFHGRQVPALLKGVDTTYQALTAIDAIITDGDYAVWDGAFERAVLGIGLANTIGIGARFISPIHLYAPKRQQAVNMLRPDENIVQRTVFIAGIFAVNQAKYDDEYMLVSLPLAQDLFGYQESEATAVELRLQDGASLPAVEQTLQAMLGDQVRVLNRYEQQADFYRIQQVEKWLTALLLVFIVLIASFNCISSLSMLIIDKQQDILILRTLGADDSLIRRIFRLEGWLVSAVGAVCGALLGLGLCLLQQQTGLLKLGNGDNYVLSAYPVHVEAADVLLAVAIVLLIGWLAACIPTRRGTSSLSLFS